MNKIILIALLLGMSAYSAVGQDRRVNIILHFYGPLSSNRAAFEDSVMTFYDVYNYAKEEIIPNIGIVREDYSGQAYKQKFVKSETGSLSFREEVKEIKKSDNRSKSQPSSILLMPYGIHQYERPSSIESNYFFLGSKKVVSKNQYASCQEIKKAIQELLNSIEIEELHIHFVSSVDDNYKDRKYDERTFAYLSQDNAGKYFLDDKGKKQLNSFSEGYANSINTGKLNTDQYFVKGDVRIGDSLDLQSSKMNDYFFQNISFSKLHYIFKKKTIEYVNFQSNILYFSYWTEVECYRPAISKYEFRLVKMRVGINREGRIVSLSEIESLGKTIAETNFNPYKSYSPKPGIPANKQGESRSTMPPPPPDPNQGPSKYEISLFASEEPVYIGGLDNLYTDIYSNIVYPDAERAAKVSGTVYVAFVVEWDGSVSNVKVEKGVENGPGLNKAAAAAVSNLGFFRPAQMNGKSIRYNYRVPIKFTLR
jgi:TonB family protein